eukprot:COSAG01_NODE_3648_length_5827_cov_4.766934_3_plen_64_part_00
MLQLCLKARGPWLGALLGLRAPAAPRPAAACAVRAAACCPVAPPVAPWWPPVRTAVARERATS